MRGLGALLIPSRREVQGLDRGCGGLGQGRRGVVGVRGLPLASSAWTFASAFASDSAGMAWVVAGAGVDVGVDLGVGVASMWVRVGPEVRGVMIARSTLGVALSLC
jgi:hypothetical protein